MQTKSTLSARALSRRAFLAGGLGLLSYPLFAQGAPATACAAERYAGGRRAGRAQSLRELGEDAGVELGCALTGWAFNDPEQGATVQGIIAREFGLATIEHGFTMAQLQPEPGVFDFSIADGYYHWARDSGLRTRAHALVYPGWITPPWVRGIFDTEELRTALRDHISAVLAHYPALDEVVVINEPWLRGHPTRQFDPFYTLLRADYIPLAFETAYAVHPTATLIYNDTLNHASVGYNGVTTQTTLDNLQRLADAGLITNRFKLGVQLHLRAAALPDWADMTRTLAGYADRFGCEVIVTEFDCDMTGAHMTAAGRARLHGAITEQALRAYLDAGVGRSFTVWGIGDAFTWLELGENRPTADATIYDDSMRMKPTYRRLQEVLRTR